MALTKEQLQEKLAEARKQIETLKNDLKGKDSRIDELEKQLVSDAVGGKKETPIENKGAIAILLGAIAKSCLDHCPHHLDEEACRNCGINKSVFNAGFKLPKPAPAQEA